jgi:hypothetical protein
MILACYTLQTRQKPHGTPNHSTPHTYSLFVVAKYKPSTRSRLSKTLETVRCCSDVAIFPAEITRQHASNRVHSRADRLSLKVGVRMASNQDRVCNELRKILDKIVLGFLGLAHLQLLLQCCAFTHNKKPSQSESKH